MDNGLKLQRFSRQELHRAAAEVKQGSGTLSQKANWYWLYFIHWPLQTALQVRRNTYSTLNQSRDTMQGGIDSPASSCTCPFIVRTFRKATTASHQNRRELEVTFHLGVAIGLFNESEYKNNLGLSGFPNGISLIQ
jgi:hypothetical protein